MCGIVGYVGGKNACEIILDGLRRLEYRGYDSAGVAIEGAEGGLKVCKSAGKVADLEAKIRNRFTAGDLRTPGGQSGTDGPVRTSPGRESGPEDAARTIEGGLGIGHTRWATHGEPNDTNAHPHLSQDGRVALVHNGTIENYRILKETLVRQGCAFSSETDTEVLVQLIGYILDTNSCSLADAVREALLQVEGAYAIAVIERGNPDLMVAARRSSPLVIGVGEGETFIASDATPIVGHTDKVIYLQDNELAVIGRDGRITIRTITEETTGAGEGGSGLSEGSTRIGETSSETGPAGGKGAPKLNIQTLKMSVAQLEKGGYPTFMLKEIFEQPTTLRDCLRGRIAPDFRSVTLSGVVENRERLVGARRMVIVACGTSWHAALIGKRVIQEMCLIPVEVEYASEFRYGCPQLGPEDVVIALSQSGETADTLAAVQLARQKGAFVYGICNVVGSSIPRNTDSGTYIHVGPEIGVASTKAFTGQVTVLTLFALCLGSLKGTLTPDQVEPVARALDRIPDTIAEVLRLAPAVEQLSRTFTFARNFLYLGRGYNYPTALEGALKLKEISYIHAEGYPAAEMKHGPIALIDDEMPSVIIAPNDSLHDKVLSNLQQVKARGGIVVAVINSGDEAIRSLANYCLEIPQAPECLTPIVASVPLQLLAYYIAVNKGRNVDKPRNLAKSVTVE